MREWSQMPKDIKKFYHDIAEQEKKKHKKLNKGKDVDCEAESLAFVKHQNT